MKRYDIYGFPTLGLEEAREYVERLLQVTFRQRDSESRGLYFLSGRSQLEGLMLYGNETPEGLRRPEFAGHPVLLTVSAVDGMDDIERRLTSEAGEPVLLRSKWIEEGADSDDGSDPGMPGNTG